MKRILFWFLYILPKNYVSFLVGKLVSLEHPQFLADWIKKKCARAFKIDMNEAEFEIDHYKSLGMLFTRKLKPGIRPHGGDVVHPADSRISQAGRIDKDILIQAKGKFFRLEKLLKSEYANRFQDGYFATYYLCPTDYHRVHSPVTGEIVETQYIPGKLWPVNDLSVETIAELFAVNERTVSIIKTARGYCALVMVGATNVGKISLSYESGIVTNQFTKAKKIQHHPPVPIRAGDEFGIFHMGSTVVMVYEKTFFDEAEFKKLIKGPVKCGQVFI